MSALIEIAVFSPKDALVAQENGAHRIELCAAMSEGGITPSHGSIVYVREKLRIPVFVMIRPRGGAFVYSTEELEIMERDIEFCRDAGVDGIVFGILTNEGEVDTFNCRRLVKKAGVMASTFHRAFDVAKDPLSSLEKIIDCGFHRILTSGQKQLAPEGADLIASLVEQAGSRIIIIPGSGVEESNLKVLHQLCGAKEYHSSAKVRDEEKTMKVNMSSISSTLTKWKVSPEKVKEMRRIADEL
ncbi:MAG: copper homeostasis protein CutC [Bacteroidetes bacterium HGW-Bacteroidetes-21]|jgi:copper homeostasis protein|nr:MAG: copper homeostasis protein CutC [Bacteroidetes bacterium HGW-Bacteroidetes-21]